MVAVQVTGPTKIGAGSAVAPDDLVCVRTPSERLSRESSSDTASLQPSSSSTHPHLFSIPSQ
ncbi:hypothetical protein MYCTH_2298519 [Thermothelomyces thermophilus ATCC 42464]|uniref:Uncharacterized protein n=1 Tax=Thermothelomyces thermophilus (strain ATCC 42464 / BCRC 31852 / DSM 1799) TaxID=573729 RepID=G2Q2G5_THET4|nr:uncharacterized protein MYCTH_2298519 [Thermothelomyces thermophilus ATCC 42464]AEO55090.1 hypothetical protein MYCTH_2298519 [Thermothelomyces thermophilus ATCC 42464]